MPTYAKKEEGRNKKGGRGGRLHEVGRGSCWKGWRKLEKNVEMVRSFYTWMTLSRIQIYYMKQHWETLRLAHKERIRALHKIS